MLKLLFQGNAWKLVRQNGADVTVLASGTGEAAAFTATSAAMAADAASGSEQGLLPEEWVGEIWYPRAAEGVDTRDFSNAKVLWRDPATSTLPLMLQSQNLPAHMEAELCGFFTSISADANRVVTATGRFYDSDAGRQARDMLMDGRRFGVSTDGGPLCEANYVCFKEDSDGFCIQDGLVFDAYEIIGATMEPHPALANAYVTLASNEPAGAEPAAEPAEEDSSPAAASLTVLRASGKDRGWLADPAHFAVPEPGLDDERLVPQRNGALAMPLTIDRDTRAFAGHLFYNGQCHISYASHCETAPPSSCGYAEAMQHPVRFTDGTQGVAGVLVYNCAHAPEQMDWTATRNYYDHTGAVLGKYKVVDGQLGAWVCGEIAPWVPEADLDMIGQLSGDWREIPGLPDIELVAVQAVNLGGLGVRRLAASGAPRFGYRVHGDRVVAAFGLNMVERTAKLAGKAPCACQGGEAPELALLRVIEQRTRALLPQRAEQVRERVLSARGR